MRSLLVLLAALFVFPQFAYAQTPPAGMFENVTLGQPMADLHATLGDPVRVLSSDGNTIWRYISNGNGTFIDVLVRNNVAVSVTLLSRFDTARYADPKGIAFGMTPDQVRAKLGPASREATNADDGSLDLWYYALPYAWIYEFHSAKLDFIQLVAAPNLVHSFKPGPATTPNDGTSLANAIWIRPSNFATNALWIDTYLLSNECGNGGHWKNMSSKFIADSANNDPFAITVIHASCTAADTERDIYFDTHGTRGPGSSAPPSPLP